jgi:competence protein ComEC
MRLAILAFVGGAAILQLSPAVPERATLLALLCAVALSTCFWRSLHWRVPAACLLGYCWAALIAQAALAESLAAADEGRDVQVVGVVDNLPFDFGQGQRFNFRIERVVAPVVALPSRVALSWYSDVDKVQPGERWQLTVRLQRPHGNANPDGFDYEAWLLEQGVRATGYVRQDAGNVRLDSFVATPASVVERARAIIRSRILAALEGRQYAPVIVALVIGDQRGIAHDGAH